MPTNLKGTSVLIVEDSITQALLLKDSLERLELKIRMAVDGVDALKQMEESLPDVVISDIIMPRMNGYELCKNIKQTPTFKNIPVILWTKLTDTQDVIKGIECGSDSFITKPCELNFILTAIENVLENKNLQKEQESKKISFFFQGERYLLQVDPIQITGLLLSTYSNAIQKNQELENANRKLNLIAEELRVKNEELKVLNDQKNQFLGMAAHDLRNPLAVIQGYSGLLEQALEETVDKKYIRMLDNIQSSSSFMIGLISDLLDISVIESGTVSLHISEVDLIQLIQAHLELLRNQAEKKKIEIKFDYEEGIPHLYCDVNKVVQIISNLVTNAIKFSHPQTKIEIGLRKSNDNIILNVKDYGSGIHPEVKERLFQPFSKGSSSGTAGEKCTGLGLLIVHKIVAGHKGKIWVESRVGEGSNFFVSFPMNVFANSVK